MNRMEQRVRDYIEEKRMILPGDTVVVGVSGGADSLCLFLILYALGAEMNFHLHVVHVHHGLRESAGEDMDFVEKLCRQLQVPCTAVQVDAAMRAKEWGIGVEEAGRKLRYDAFRQVCERLAEQDGSVKTSFRIAVAHHREDQAETVLFHLCRGTDLRGARGMLPVNGQIIRPLLQESRTSIEQYLTQKGFAWQEDETNTDTAYTRNYLRREILPRLEEGVHGSAAERIAQFASACADAEAYLEAKTDEAAQRCLCGPAYREGIDIPEKYNCRYVLSLRALHREDPYLQRRVLYRFLAASTDSGKDIGTVHVDALQKLCAKETDGRLSMPSRVTVFRSAGRLFFCRDAESAEYRTEMLSQRTEIAANRAERIPQQAESAAMNTRPAADKQAPFPGYPLAEREYDCRLLDFDGNMSSIPRNEYTKWFDYDKIGTFPVFRTRQPGDYMRLFSDMKTKKIARIMLDGKVPAGIRDKIVLPFFGKEALWIPGLRMGDSCKVGPATTRILEIHWNSDNDS